MDLAAIMTRFVDDNGQISLPPDFTIPALTEMLYASAVQAGQADTINIRFWDYSTSTEGETTEYTRREVNTRIKALSLIHI